MDVEIKLEDLVWIVSNLTGAAEQLAKHQDEIGSKGSAAHTRITIEIAQGVLDKALAKAKVN